MAKKEQPAKKEADAVQLILKNRKLRHEYEVLETWEAGMVLSGSEVKSLRAGDVQWADAHARLEKKELWLFGLHIGEYREANVFGHQPTQPRKLLLTRRELDKIIDAMRGKGLTIVPDELHFRRGFAKIVICLARGKRREDKRRDMIERDSKRDVEREMSRRTKMR
jgi:SsrA-binding protein